MYDIQALPGPSNSDSEALGMNSYGDVVGAVYPQDAQGNLYIAGALWSGGSMSYSLPQGSESILYGVNSSGDAVGLRGFDNSPTQIAILVDGGAITDLKAAVGDGSIATRINASGDACGWTWNDTRSFIYNKASNAATWINPLPGTAHSFSGSINDASEVAGSSDNNHAFLYSSGSLKDLGVVAFVEDINQAGVICGSIGKPSPQNFRAAIYDTKQASPMWVEIALPEGAVGSHGQGINDQGDIVGTYWTEQSYDGEQSAYIYSDGASTDLNTLIAIPGWHLEFANKINGRGQICGRGTLNGQVMGFLLTPQPSHHHVLTLPMLVAMLFGGVTRDGSGWAWIGGHRVPIGPWGPWTTLPSAKRDALIALAMDEIAMFISDRSTRETVRRTLMDAAKESITQLAQMASEGRAGPLAAIRSNARVQSLRDGKSIDALRKFPRR